MDRGSRTDDDSPLNSPDTRRRPAVAAAAGPGVSASGLVTLCAGAIVVAAIYLGRDLLVPLVLAVLLAFVLAPLVGLLRRARIPRVPAVLLTVLLAFAVIVGAGLVVSRQVTDLAANLPAYQATIQRKVESLRIGELLAELDALPRRFGPEPAPVAAPPPPGVAPPPPAAPVPAARPETSAIGVLRGVAEPLLEPLATAGIVLVFVIFVLLYREDLRDRLIRLAGSRDLHRTMAAMNDAAYRLSRFFLAQVALNTGFGLFIAGGLWLIGLPSPLLWGILAGLMRFVPFIGIFIAVIPPVLFALAVDPGWGLALWVLGLFLISEPMMGQVFEPLLYGRSTGLSPVSVIVSATFWTFLWGPIGLLLATPLTVCLVVLGRHVDRLEFLDVMLGDRPPLLPEETFYQRALEGDADGLVDQAKRRLRETGGSLSAYYDEVALRGLGLAQADWAREVLEPERMEGIRTQVETLLDDLAEMGGPAADAAGGAQAAAGPAPPWRLDGAVLCVAGRGQFDDLAAAMAAQVLRREGFGARAEPNAALETANLGRLDPERVRLCCLSVLEEGSSAASVRYFLRRLRRRLPAAQVVVGLWHVPADSPMLAALTSEGPGEVIVTSLREVVAMCQAVAAQAVPGDGAAQAATADGATPRAAVERHGTATAGG